MVEPGAGDSASVASALACVPDLPRWVDTRGMLLSGRAKVWVAPVSPVSVGFVATAPDSALASVVGHPPAELIRAAVASLGGDVNLLSPESAAGLVREAFPAWRRRTAVVHVLPGPMPWEQEAERDTRVFTRETAPRFDHVPPPLRGELAAALGGRTISRYVPGEVPDDAAAVRPTVVPMSAAWASGRPVAFCYPVWQTEQWWDVSIDTLEAYRSQGLGARAARAMIRHMRFGGRAPVWGAIDTNAASRALAAKLGFIETAGIAVFTAA